MKNSAFFRLLSVGLCVFLLGACAAPRSEGVKMENVFPGLASSEPPPPLVEEIPEILEPRTAFWRSGYWAYDGEEFFWIPGALAQRPHPTAQWSPERWEKRAFGWAFVPGRWF